MKIILIKIVLLFLCIHLSNGLRCYSCYTTQNDLTCLNDLDPEGGDTVDCPGFGAHCVIFRQDLTESPGIASSFRRECSTSRPPILNSVVKTPMYITYYRSCQVDLCNTGDAIEADDFEDPNFGNIDFVFIKSENSAHIKSINIFLALIAYPISRILTRINLY